MDARTYACAYARTYACAYARAYTISIDINKVGARSRSPQLLYITFSLGKRNWDERIPHQNWPIILGLIVVHNTAFSILTPSIYQFITTPRSIPEELKTKEVCEKYPFGETVGGGERGV